MSQQLSCGVCFEKYNSGSTPAESDDRRPMTVCLNGHTLCATCVKAFRERSAPCSFCREVLLPNPIVNRALIELMEEYIASVEKVPQIPLAELTIEELPFASGAFSDVYDAHWLSQRVALKAIRLVSRGSEQLKQLEKEAKISVGLHHPNIVRVFGTCELSDRRLAIVMERGDVSLAAFVKDRPLHLKANSSLLLHICLGILDGLRFLHGKRIAHRDLKPENILLFGGAFDPKISDFGTSKVLQTLIQNSALTGTPKYAAPELLEKGKLLSCSVDVFSFAMIAFELFTGKRAEEDLGDSVMQIMFAIATGKRPAIPASFPVDLKPLIERGWAIEPSARPSVDDFRLVLLKMRAPASVPTPAISQVSISTTSFHAPVIEVVAEPISKILQSKEVALMSLPLPSIALCWNDSCELLNSKELRAAMLSDLKNKSDMKTIINGAVLNAIGAVPRHLFVEKTRIPAFLNSKNAPTEKDIVAASYLYNRPIPATKSSNESSPEIIGSQLSFTEILPGHNVLLVGVKGGYIASLVAQLVGIHGSVTTASSDKEAVAVCKARVEEHCPLKSVVRWEVLPDIRNPDSISAHFANRKLEANGGHFHGIIYCGAVPDLPTKLTNLLSPPASLMAPVKHGNGQQFRVLKLKENQANMEIRAITDFGVIFEDIK